MQIYSDKNGNSVCNSLYRFFNSDIFIEVRGFDKIIDLLILHCVCVMVASGIKNDLSSVLFVPIASFSCAYGDCIYQHKYATMNGNVYCGSDSKACEVTCPNILFLNNLFHVFKRIVRIVYLAYLYACHAPLAAKCVFIYFSVETSVQTSVSYTLLNIHLLLSLRL